ncbi:MAG: hypothetical protein IJG38_02395 [Thermoguttaceae bacterium]|nr:hypothetical protein [Thermoguttaceae bacterium]
MRRYRGIRFGKNDETNAQYVYFRAISARDTCREYLRSDSFPKALKHAQLLIEEYPCQRSKELLKLVKEVKKKMIETMNVADKAIDECVEMFHYIRRL